ncbi:MAG: PKD domain-containing protein [Solirubrobacterales bacterium]
MAAPTKRLLILCTVAASLLAATFAQAASAATVTVVPNTGPATSFDLADLTGSFDVHSNFMIRKSKSSSVNQLFDGISIRSLLDLAGADAYTRVDITTASGAVRLTRAQVEDTAHPLPSIYQAGALAGFIRPSYSSTDFNAADMISGDAITIKQSISSTDGPLAKATASKTTVKVKQSVSFTASVSNAASGEQFAYTWTFDDGNTATGESPKHTFKKRGTYRVLLTATPKAGGSPAYGVVKIQVGAAAKSKKKQTGGGTNESAGAPATGAADGDSGDGDQAATDGGTKTTKKKKKKAKTTTPSDLERVSGELMASSEPIVVQQSTLAARSGQQTVPQAKGLGITTDQAAGLAALLLLAGGALLEFNIPQNFRRRLRGT